MLDQWHSLLDPSYSIGVDLPYVATAKYSYITLDIGSEDFQCSIHTSLTTSTQPEQIRSACRTCGRAQCESFQNVHSTPHTALENNLHPVADSIDNLRQNFDRRRRGIELAAAMSGTGYAMLDFTTTTLAGRCICTLPALFGTGRARGEINSSACKEMVRKYEAYAWALAKRCMATVRMRQAVGVGQLLVLCPAQPGQVAGGVHASQVWFVVVFVWPGVKRPGSATWRPEPTSCTD